MSERVRSRLLGCIGGGLLVASGLSASIAAPPALAHDPFLARLEGRWRMTGAVGHTPVAYSARGRWTLADGWLCLSMVDAARPPAYAADVFFGFDPKAGDYVVHWLDRFGAAGARVVGTGRRDQQTLVFEIPYAEATFRDTLTIAADGASGSLLIESKDTAGRVTTFASYTLTRAK